MSNKLTTKPNYPLSVTPKNEVAPQNIKKMAVIEALQNPLVLGSTTVCVGSFLYFITLASTIGGGAIALTITGLSGLASLGLGVWHGIIKNKDYVQAQIDKDNAKEKQKNEELRIKELKNSEYILLNGFKGISFSIGLKTFNDIKSEYDNIIDVFSNTNMHSIIDIDKTKQVVDEVYRQGLGILSLSLEISKQLHLTDSDSLKQELKELKANLAKTDETNNLYNVYTEKISKNDKTLKLIKKNKDRVDELLCQAGLCEDALRDIRLELPELLMHKSQDDLDSALSELNIRTEYAQRVIEEYKKQGL